MLRYVVLIPNFNDWEPLNLLIPRIDQTLQNTKEEFSILIVNDGSTKKKQSIISKNIKP